MTSRLLAKFTAHTPAERERLHLLVQAVVPVMNVWAGEIVWIQSEPGAMTVWASLPQETTA